MRGDVITSRGCDRSRVNGAFAEAAKYVAQRPLPLTYAGDPTLLRTSGGYRSFYSGHTSTAFAF